MVIQGQHQLAISTDHRNIRGVLKRKCISWLAVLNIEGGVLARARADSMVPMPCYLPCYLPWLVLGCRLRCSARAESNVLMESANNLQKVRTTPH